MRNLQEILKQHTQKAVEQLFSVQLENIELQQTKKEFEGDITIVIFPMLRQIKGNPEQIGQQIGTFLQENVKEVESFNVIKGFLNFSNFGFLLH
ncbi:hypothetical protein CCAN11_30026 [Capnocytophaga canimorsus]|uniref:Arginyl tRNA synthetase N-terminal domain-containing protein n=1 Tax=Capnocytophaga canimorsus TaxID=28188 RepID=A0A0B7ISG8_9FLAO|nr:hypothetical protein CCAN11_30026 [Capnocytophaga canimorsus]